MQMITRKVKWSENNPRKHIWPTAGFNSEANPAWEKGSKWRDKAKAWITSTFDGWKSQKKREKK